MQNKFKNNLLLVIISALCTGISMQPLSLGFLAWFSLVPLFYVLNQSNNNYKNILAYSFLWGFVYHIIVVFWLLFNIGMPEVFGSTKVLGSITMFVVVLILSFNTILIGIIWYRLKTKYPSIGLVLFPVTWVSIEFVRSYGFLGFPWISIANSQIDYLFLIQNAEITSIYGISFWVVLINVFIYSFIFINKHLKSIIILVFIAVLPWITGFILFDKSNNSIQENQSLSITSIQPNILLEEKRSGVRYTDNNKRIIVRNFLLNEVKNYIVDSDLVLLPESSLQGSPMDIPENKYLLFGTTIRENNNITYNSSVLYSNAGMDNVYHKKQLVPMVEYIPLSEFFPSLREFTSGEENTVFNINDFNFIAPICFESTFPHLNRKLINDADNIDAIIYLVNDGWYINAPQPQQHSRQSIFRAIENRKPVIRCANTGISMHINQNGEVVDQIKLNQAGVLEDIKIYKNKNKTFYTRFGNVFALMLFILNIVLLIRSFFIKENNE